MAAAYHPYQMDYHHIQPMEQPHRRSFFDDDESILDDNILDNGNLLDNGIDVSSMDRRRGAPALDSTIFNPSADWDYDQDMSMAGPADDSTPVPATFDHSHGTNNPFIKLEQQSQPSYAQQHNWSAGASGSCTPTVYDNNSFAGYDEQGSFAMGAQGAFDNNGHLPAHAVYPQNGSMPSSPAHKEWTNGAGPADHDGQNKRHMTSPGPRPHSPLHVVRRDGIRKKNARFDIPAERTLMNIDQLISRSQDENEIKELKQQKRLLRNRQAA